MFDFIFRALRINFEGVKLILTKASIRESHCILGFNVFFVEKIKNTLKKIT